MSEDYVLPPPRRRNAKPYYEALQNLFRTKDISVAIGEMNNRLQNVDEQHALWAAVDEDGNTILHNLAIRSKTAAVEEVLRNAAEYKLLDVRNDAGDTPMDALLDYLETSRTKRSYYMELAGPDQFGGFSTAAVVCLALLMIKDMPKISDIETQQLRYGCTCGACTGGFLSSRMSFALECQADLAHDSLSMILSTNPDDFLDCAQYDLQFVERSIQDKLDMDALMQNGFVAFFRHFANCLRDKELPTEANVLPAVLKWPEILPASYRYVTTGGKVNPIGSQLFSRASEQDRWAGDGEHYRVYAEDIDQLPRCRNDHEFGFVSRMCGYRCICPAESDL